MAWNSFFFPHLWLSLLAFGSLALSLSLMVGRWKRSNSRYTEDYLMGTATTPSGAVPGDWTGQGFESVIAGASTATATLYNNTNGLGFIQTSTPFTPSNPIVSAFGGDFDGDGDLDYLYSTSASDVEWGRNDGTGTMTVTTLDNLAGTPISVHGANFFGNALLMLSCSDALGIRAYNATTNATNPVLPVLGLSCSFMTTGDVNSDGAPDIVYTHSPSTVRVVLNSGTPFAPGVPFPWGTGIGVSSESIDSPLGLGLGDLDNDGIVDLAVASGGATNIIILFRGANDGNFRESSLLAGSNTLGITVADMNNDTLPDIVGGRAGATIIRFQSPPTASLCQGLITLTNISGLAIGDVFEFSWGDSQVSAANEVCEFQILSNQAVQFEVTAFITPALSSTGPNGLLQIYDGTTILGDVAVQISVSGAVSTPYISGNVITTRWASPSVDGAKFTITLQVESLSPPSPPPPSQAFPSSPPPESSSTGIIVGFVVVIILLSCCACIGGTFACWKANDDDLTFKQWITTRFSSSPSEGAHHELANI